MGKGKGPSGYLALKAARESGFQPNPLDEYDVVSGPRAVSFVIQGLGGNWILCVQEHGQDDWYVSGDLTEGGARGAAMDYAYTGL